MNPLISIIIPSWNNMDYLVPCVNSIATTGVLNGMGELIIVNNGDYPLTQYFSHLPNTRVIESGENLGWEGGLKKGLEYAKAPYICFQNDDTVIPPANTNFYTQLLYPFHDPKVAAVGPATTVASGRHSVFQQEPLKAPTVVSYLIFFTVMVERKALEAAGGIDASAPGGDDFDLSIRLRDLGRELVINPFAFLIHHGFKSGTRLKGDNTQANGWNSREMIDKTNQWLIQKHGFRKFIYTQWGVVPPAKPYEADDKEGNLIRLITPLPSKVIELGCGGQKTITDSVGVDRVAAGQIIPHVNVASVADIVMNVDGTFPEEMKGKYDVVIARHILEHCVDTVQTVKEWASLLSEGGEMIIAVPNQDFANSIPMNPEHVHAFTPESLSRIMGVCGLVQTDTRDPGNGVSFVSKFSKPFTQTQTLGSESALCLK